MKKQFWMAAFYMTLSICLFISIFFLPKETDDILILSLFTISFLFLILFGAIFAVTLLEVIQPYKFSSW